MTITRRDFLSASGLVASASLLGSVRAAPLPREVDVVVVGGGAAGIAAARRVIAAGQKAVILEAAAELGGRCVTDATSFEVPFDRGARWIHNPDISPMAKLARGAGVELLAAPLGRKIRIGRRNARAGEAEEFLAALVRTNRALDEAARGRIDVSCASALPKDLGDWTATTEFVLGANAAGKDLKDFSVIDKVRGQERNASPLACRQGLGTLVTRLGASLPVMLSTPVSRIVWSGRDVQVETASGRLSARAAIVTVSTNMLVAGSIKFAPDLPRRQLDAAAALSLGSQDRIALHMTGNPLGLGRDEVVVEQSSDRQTGSLLANVGGSALCVVDVGGSFGRDLSAQGEAAMVAFAMEWLTRLYGSDVAGAVKKSAATRWDEMPFVRGAMSCAPPGGQPSRRILAEPLGALFLTGEASHETMWGTVDGAWESGERAADAALRKLGVLRDSDNSAPAASSRRRATPPRSNRAGGPVQ